MQAGAETTLDIRLIGKVAEGDLLTVRAVPGGEEWHTVIAAAQDRVALAGRIDTRQVAIQYSGRHACASVVETVNGRALVLRLVSRRRVDIAWLGAGPAPDVSIRGLVHEAVQQPSTRGFELIPGRHLERLAETLVSLDARTWASVSGVLWADDGHHATFHDLPTAARPARAQATVAWARPGSLSARVMGEALAERSLRLQMLIADRAYGITGSFATERADEMRIMETKGARARARSVPPAGELTLHGLWSVAYDVHVVDQRGIAWGWTEVSVPPGGRVQTAVVLRPHGTLRLVNASARAARCLLLSSTGGIVARFEVAPSTDESLPLPVGDYLLRGWVGDAGVELRQPLAIARGVTSVTLPIGR